MTRYFTSLAAAALIATSPIATKAAEPLVETLVSQGRASLDLVPIDLMLANNAIYVIGTQGTGGRLIKLDPATLQEVDRQDFNVIPRVIRPGRDGMLFMVADSDRGSVALAIDPDLKVTGRLDLGVTLVAPSLTISSEDRLIVSNLVLHNMGKAGSQGIFYIDARDPTALTPVDILDKPLAMRTAVKAWLSQSENALFLNSADDFGLFAFDDDLGRKRSELLYATTRDLRKIPFSVSGVMADAPCGKVQQTSFLLADNLQDTISVVVYNSFVEELFFVARVKDSPNRNRTRQTVFPGTNVVVPETLVGTSCNQSLVLRGNLNSQTVSQFSRRLDIEALEKVGTLPLGFYPTALAVHPNGDAAYFVSAESRAISVFGTRTRSLGNAAMELTGSTNEAMVISAPEPEPAATRLDGDINARNLQRALSAAGYKISIDGFFGPQTERALSLANIQLDLGLTDTSKAGINAALEAFANRGIKK